MAKLAKNKRCDITLVEEGSMPYTLLAKARGKWHSDLAEARIVLAWRTGWKQNRDGRLTLGRCLKATDLQRELRADCDFVIFLNKDMWDLKGFTDARKLALLDHELCHAAPMLDAHDNQKVDARGRKLWRSRGHDVEEFRSVIQHHGIWKADLAKFAEALLKKAEKPLLAAMEKDAPPTMPETNLMAPPN